MRNLPIVAGVLLVVAYAAPLPAAEYNFPDKIGEWTATGPAKSGEPLVDAARKLPPVLSEAGLSETITRPYKLRDRSAELTLRVFSDSSGAYQGFTYLGQQDLAPGRPRVVVNEGNLVLSITGLEPADLADGSFRTWLKTKADKTPAPPIAGFLPREDLVEGTRIYALGPAAFEAAASQLERPAIAALSGEVGFRTGTEVMFARYRDGKDHATLLLLAFPTPQMAGLHQKHLEQGLAEAAKRDGTRIERKGSLLSIVVAPSSPAYAERLRNAVNYETQVTWNEPSQTLTDAPWLVTVEHIFRNTFVFCGLAIGLGIAFGGVRIVIKRLFPGKVFDRPKSIEVLQLGLSGKTIDPSDFY